MAMDSLTTGLLQEGHNVKVLTLHTHKHPFLESELTSTYLETTEFEAVFAAVSYTHLTLPTKRIV